MSSFATMASALLYLRVTSLVGRVKSRLKRLKQPKYLAGAVVGAAYMYFAFIRRATAPHTGYGAGTAGGPPPPEIPPDAFVLFAELGALLLLIVVIVNWVIPRRATLAFSEAEIAFLFPAPVNRRMLIHYRLLGSQFGIIFSALILTLALRRGQGLGGNPWFHAIGWWLVLATLNLHFTGTSFVYSKLLNRSITTARRKAITFGAAVVLACALILWTWSVMRLPQQSDIGSVREIASYVAAQLHAGPLPWLLAIPKFLIGPYFAVSTRGFLLALGPALAVLVVHYFWVLRTEVSFEEASIARAEKRAARVRAVQQGDWRGQTTTRKSRRPPFNLRSTGRPELAFLWKNLLSTSAFFRPRVAMIVLAIILVGSVWLVQQPSLAPARLFIVMMFGMMLAVTLVFGPQVARQDLRSDLPNADILKTYPLRGWQIVLGEMLTPPFVAIQLLVPNAAAVFFPAWAQSVRNRAERGIEVMGQRLIFISGQWLITAVAALPAALAAAVIFVVTQWIAGFGVAAVLAVATVFSVLAVEAWLGVRWLGSHFEQFDLSAELQP